MGFLKKKTPLFGVFENGGEGKEKEEDDCERICFFG